MIERDKTVTPQVSFFLKKDEVCLHILFNFFVLINLEASLEEISMAHMQLQCEKKDLKAHPVSSPVILKKAKNTKT